MSMQIKASTSATITMTNPMASASIDGPMETSTRVNGKMGSGVASENSNSQSKIRSTSESSNRISLRAKVILGTVMAPFTREGSERIKDMGLE